MTKLSSVWLFIQFYFEFCFLVALGESLLGNYAESKKVSNLPENLPGKKYSLRVRDERQCIFSTKDLCTWLQLSKMNQVEDDLFIRVINGGERFTPPALLLGLAYTWYLDNRLASHIEYKMSVLKIASKHLIPAEKEMAAKRRQMITFLREVVFTPHRVIDVKR